MKYKGKYIKCIIQEDRYPYIFDHEERKIGKWIAYYPSGVISEVSQYTNTKKCEQPIFKEGIWKFYNQGGILYKSEKYLNDTLIHKDIDIYDRQYLIGEITMNKYSIDTILYEEGKLTKNIIPNASFEQYFYKPVTIINNGQNQIQELIPYWYSPNKTTADYYNKHRKVKGIPEHFYGKTEDGNNGYVGLMLFLSQKGTEVAPKLGGIDTNAFENHFDTHYTESIQARLLQTLSQGNHYCFKARIALSKNAGYDIDRFEVIFSDRPIYFNYQQSPGAPSLSFSDIGLKPGKWVNLCQGFTARGNEAYITLGRFSKIAKTKVIPQVPDQSSELDVNGSAYYLIDDLQLFKVASMAECDCKSVEERSSDTTASQNFENMDIDELPINTKIILSNIYFDFDKANIKNSFTNELERLLDYLKKNQSFNIIISGYTDNEGDEQYNLKLSMERASSCQIMVG